MRMKSLEEAVINGNCSTSQSNTQLDNHNLVRGVEGISNNLGNTESENSDSDIGLDVTTGINMNLSMNDDASLSTSSCNSNVLENRCRGA